MKPSFLTPTLLLLSFCICFTSCAGPNEKASHSHDPNPSMTENDRIQKSTSEAKELPKSSSMQIVEVKDQALNMTMMTLKVPAAWVLHQDIASNPNGSGYLKFLLAMESPEGEIQGFLPLMMNYFSSVQYGQEVGTGFENLVHYLMHYCSQPFLEKFSPSLFRKDHEALNTNEGKQYRQYAENLVTNPNYNYGSVAHVDFDIIKMEFNAFRKNIPYKGKLNVVKLGAIDQYPGMAVKSGVIIGGFTLAPEDLFAAAIERKIDMDMKVNPQWDAKRSQIIDMETQRMSQDHQARRAQQRQQFNAHQQNMASMRQTFDQQNQAWYERNFGSGGSSSYSGNASVTDAITGYSSFSDPYTGQQIKKEGHYNYWYTNEFGEYHGTNDPSFQPGNHYSGNWTPIQPLKPDH
ncbi:hypothetical protein [Mongoliibacter sp.]|uniref:hypothetical protein n=1 Tax=Mongoliibacter sp. TaxID=2022438 RepID=UPI0025E59ED4|nr:hypothetical protein [Mongoliibacter sp.]